MIVFFSLNLARRQKRYASCSTMRTKLTPVLTEHHDADELSLLSCAIFISNRFDSSRIQRKKIYFIVESVRRT